MQEPAQEPIRAALDDELKAALGDAIELSQAPSPWLDALGLDASARIPLASPRDEEAASALISWAGRRARAFAIAGGATKLATGAAPASCSFVLGTKYLSQVFDFDVGNTTIEAGAGITLRELDAFTRQQRQFVPLESLANSTLGGVASSNASGTRSLKWGTPRDLVLGARALLSDGRQVRGGGKVVKNVAGYDLPKLFVGCRGSLGLLTRLTLRLRPLPERALRLAWACGSLSQAEQLWQLLEGREFEWSGLRAEFQGRSWQLLAWCEGSERAVAHQLERAPQAASVEDAEGVECQDAWPEAVQVSARLPRTEARPWLEAASRSGARRLSWECASGSVRAGWDEVAWEPLAALREAAQTSGGWMILENGPRDWKSWERVWGARRSDWPLMQRLKAAYDAANVCAPGRFAGGL